VVSFTPITSGKEEQDAGWASQPVWIFKKRKVCPCRESNHRSF